MNQDVIRDKIYVIKISFDSTTLTQNKRYSEYVLDYMNSKANIPLDVFK